MRINMASEQLGRLATKGFQQKAGKKISAQVLIADLKICSRTQDLQRGREIHAIAVESGHASNMYVMSALVRMYAKCGSTVEARHVFDSIQEPDVVCWNTLLLGYVENREGLVSLDLFLKMKASGCAPSSVTYIAALKACTSLAVDADFIGKKNCLKRGREIHLEIGSNVDHYVQNTLIDMYAKCGSMTEAHSVFDNIQKPDVVSWNALLLGYVGNGKGLVALDLFSSMKASGCAPDPVTYVAALKACTSLAVNGNLDGKRRCLERGRQIHSEIGSKLNQYVYGALIDMYSKCGNIVEAHRVIDGIQKPDVVCWNNLLLGYAESGAGLICLDLFSRMKASGCEPSSVTYVAVLMACISLVSEDGRGKEDCLKWGRQIHLEIGNHLDSYVQSRLIDMYAKGGSMVEARHVFNSIQKPDLVSWTALISGYAENGEGLIAVDMFSTMKASGCAPDALTYVAALKACGLIGALALGRKLHSEITEFSAHVVTCLVDFYGQCGSVIEAREVFDVHSKARDITTWNALLAGYGRFGDSKSVFDLLEAMQEEGFQPDAVTFLCMLSCCSHAGLVEKAREYFDGMHARYGVTPTLMHYSCMVDVLGRANLLNEAIVLLQKMTCNPGAVTWMSLLGACRKWKNVEIGSMAFQFLAGRDEKVAAANVLIAQIYGSGGVLEASKAGACKLPTEAYVLDEMGKTITFVTGERGPPEVEKKLQELCKNMNDMAYVSGAYNISESLCAHNERRAAVYGILKIPASVESVKVFKNMRMCGDCHVTIKMISKLSQRVLMIRDASRFHVMVDGNCSCEDHW